MRATWRVLVCFAFLSLPQAGMADEQVWAIQSQLRALGFAPGPSDGSIGPGTRGAINAFYTQQGLESPEDLALVFSDLRAAILDDVNLATRADLEGSETGAYPIALPLLPRAPFFRDVFRSPIDINNDGETELFVMQAMYHPRNDSLKDRVGYLAFFERSSSGRWQERVNAIDNRQDFCLHPRGIAKAELNGDAYPDLFIACHGFDGPPYSGEKNRVLLSQPDGTYRIETPTEDIGFYHSATAADFDGDGDIDILASDKEYDRQFWLFDNDGAGNFVTGRFRQPAEMDNRWPVFTVNVLDLNSDGLFDLFVAGHEWENMPTTVFLNDGSFNFRRSRAVQIPPLLGHGVVLDATVTGAPENRSLWLMRTAGGDGAFYKGRTIQQISFPQLDSRVALQNLSMRWSPHIATWKDAGVVLVGDDIGGLVLEIEE